MRKISCIILLAAACFLAASCGAESEDKAPRTYTVGFSQCTDDLWRKIMMIQMEAAAASYSNLNLVIKDAQNDNERQIAQIREMMDMGVDLLIISPNESQPITRIAEEAYDMGIPTVIWDRKVETDKFTTFISADNYAIGRDVGQYIASILPKGSTVLEICGLRGSSPAQERHQGFKDVVNGDYQIRQVVGNWQHAVAKARVEDIRDYDDIDLVFGHNDDMALAAYEAIAERDSADAARIKFIGIDAIVGVDAVIDGRLEASFLYPPGGEFVIATAMKILRGEYVDKNYVLKSFIVDKSNATTLQSQSEQILNYQSQINHQRKELDAITSNYHHLRHSVPFLIIILLASAGIAVYSLLINRRIRRNNRQLSEKNESIEARTRELVIKNTQIENLTNQKLQFFTNLSHEVRTPLTLILNPLEKIAKKETDPLIQRDIWTIQRNAKHLLNIVNQILDFRKIENNKMILSVREVDIISFTNEIIKYFEAYAESEKIVFKFVSDIKSQQMWIDTDKIEQVLLNLISNAFKNSRKYGIITVSVTDSTDSVIIEVHDTGRGIALQDREHIFDRFYSIDNPPHHGIGIGLHLSKEYVQMHKGVISVDSEVDKFTSFRVELRKGRAHFPKETVFVDAPDESEVPDKDKMGEASHDLLTKHYEETVLIAEDDNDIRAYLESELSENFNVITASDGYEATQKMIEGNVSIVLSDVLMPHINGYQLCRDIKSNVATSHIPVILLTALTDDSQRIYGIAEGADEYIRKPFNIDYVKIKIIRILEDRRRIMEDFRKKITADSFLDVDVKEIPCADDVFRDKLFELMENSYEDNRFNIESMSGSLSMSRVQLFRKSKKLFGMSPTDLLRSFRLNKAAKLIQNGGFTISEVAYMTGFSTPAYFTKCFKEKFGTTPKSYTKI